MNEDAIREELAYHEWRQNQLQLEEFRKRQEFEEWMREEQEKADGRLD